MQCPRRAPTMVPISNVYRSGFNNISEIFSRLKKPLKMNHPRMNPDTKRMEYHLRPKEPIWKITGSTCQWTNNISSIRKYINSPFRLSIYNLVRPNNLQIYAYFRISLYFTQVFHDSWLKLKNEVCGLTWFRRPREIMLQSD